jgi:hypothetical protein
MKIAAALGNERGRLRNVQARLTGNAFARGIVRPVGRNAISPNLRADGLFCR